MAAYEPKISAVTMTPNPVNINWTFLVSVSVTEVEVVMYRVSPTCGSTVSGEVITLTAHKEVAS